MDVHRCRFVPYPPQAINALAFSRQSNPQKSCPADQRLAIGRANGEIEIWNPAGGDWMQETTFPGGADRSVEGLAWTQDLEDEEEEAHEGQEEEEEDGEDKMRGVDTDHEDVGCGKLRLFSAGFSSVVTEWDLVRGVPLRHANGNFGAIWCLVAQPRWNRTDGARDDVERISSLAERHDQYLAAGCEDGTIVLFSTEDGDLTYLRTMAKPPSKKPRTLSLIWQNRNTLVAGYSDSHIRVYDVQSRQNIRTMSLGKPGTGGNETLVWVVKCLPNGNILSGDSAGDLKLWDGTNYSLMQTIHSHEADILDITTNTEGSMVITGGADRRTVAYKPVLAGKQGKAARWAQVMHRRFHQHDVKSLASFESRDLNITVSGGLDTAPIVLPLPGWHQDYHRTLPHLPRTPPVSSAPQARLFISWWDRQVSIWHLSPHMHSSAGSEEAVALADRHVLVAKIMLIGEENITSADISEDGKHLVVATVSGVRLFRLRMQRDYPNGRIIMRTKKLPTPSSLDRLGARHVAFSPDANWLCSIGLESEIVLMRMEITSDTKSLLSSDKRVIKLNRTGLEAPPVRQNAGLGGYLDTVNSISFSADSRLLAIGDLSGRIVTWILRGEDGRSDGLVNGSNESKHKARTSDSSDESSSDDDSSSADESDSDEIQGQPWRMNPTGRILSNLKSPILVLSFRHSTAHHSTGEDRLIAVTSDHKVTEFQVLRGNLSDWSRRNPPSYLPERFRQVKERAKGLVWDVSDVHERLWLYGSSWMLMLDMAQDLPSMTVPPASEQQSSVVEPSSPGQRRKRKREDLEVGRSRRTQGKGAGGPIHMSESYVGITSYARDSQDSAQDSSQPLLLDKTTAWPCKEERDTTSPLVRLRRGADEQKSHNSSVNGQVNNEHGGANGAEHASQRADTVQLHASKSPAYFLSLQYRSILGIVPIGGSGKARPETDAASGVEVAIIERPRWDLDLPPRFDGGQSWES